MSESQERMMAVVEPAKVERFLEICRKWEVDATVVGEVTEVSEEERERGGRLVIEWHGDVVVDVPPRTVAHDGPVYQRPFARPAWQDALQSDAAEKLPRPVTGDQLRETLLTMVASPNLCDRSWITDQYDRYVLGNTVLAQPEDAGMVRIDEESGLGVALATDCNGRFAKLDPYTGAQLALAESYRNVATSGARPLAVSDCLNFGSPEDPEVMWQFAEAVRGLADGCQELGIPVTGGNVSLYNQTGGTAILPTPVVAVLGVIEDVTRRTPVGFADEGQAIYLVGSTAEELSGSEWAHVVHDHLGGLPPKVDLAAERRLADLLVEASQQELLAAAHDVSDGGLAQTLVEACLRRGVGARVELPGGLDPFVALFAESAGRAVVAVAPEQEPRFSELCAATGLEVHRLGTTEPAGPDAGLTVEDEFSVSLADLRAAWSETLPAALA
jgi:phosphoribosylformylglycinamidine synthase subunit PurL